MAHSHMRSEARCPRRSVGVVACRGLALAAALALPMSGCGTTVVQPDGSRVEATPAEDRIVSMSVQAIPNAVNWDSDPDPDGIQVRLFLFSAGKADSVQLSRGAIDFILYEGRVTEFQSEGVKPFHTWTFTSAQLAGNAGQGLIGWSYEPPLGWGKQVPKTHTITLLVCVRQPGFPPLYSVPTLLSMGR